MLSTRFAHPSLPLAILALIGALVSSGCGGGGGGPAKPYLGRSFELALAAPTNRVLSMSIDAVGRFTIYAIDAAGLPSSAGAQGNLGLDRTFFAQSADNVIQFRGTVALDGLSVTGAVERGGANIFSFTANVLVAGGATPADLVGTFLGASGATTAMLSLDPTGHATLWATDGTRTGGGPVTVSATGNLQTADSSTLGRLTSAAGAFTLNLSKLGGATVSINLTVERVTRAKWTFMVFLNAANNLQEFAPLNMNQMEKIGSTADVNMVVQWKQEECSGCGTPDFLGTRRYFVTKDNNTNAIGSELVQDMGRTVDMGDWRELRNFITWSQARYPADHYAVVIWNHGAGWRPTRAGDKRPIFPRSVSIDDHTRSEIQIWELPQALNVSPKMDSVIFDASLMQMAEVAFEIRDLATVMVGSEESPPGEGYVYDTFLSDLVANPAMTAAQLGTHIVNRTLDSYGSSGNNTQSAINLSKMSAFATRLDAFATSLSAHVGDSSAAMTTARTTAESYSYPENKDLWHYAELIRTGTSANDLKTSAVNLQQAIVDSLIAERHGSINGNSHGIAIYVPSRIDYLSSYANLALSRVTSWDSWLQNQP